MSAPSSAGGTVLVRMLAGTSILVVAVALGVLVTRTGSTDTPIPAPAAAPSDDTSLATSSTPEPRAAPPVPSVVPPPPDASPTWAVPPAPHVDLTAEPALTDDDLRVAARVDALVRSPELARTGVALSISLRDPFGRDVYDLAGDQPRLPASTSKVVTAAAALAAFGPDHRFTTTVRGATHDAGTVTGDLFLVGDGDPTLTTDDYRTHVFPSRPSTSLEALADAVVAAGVREVRGGVVGDGSILADDGLPEGWKEDYLPELDGRVIAGLTVDAGIDLIVEEVEGRGPDLTMLAHPSPPRRAAERLTDLLRERGVVVARPGRRITVPAPARPEIASVASPPLRELLTFMVQRSDNHLADSLFRLLGARPAGAGTWDAAEDRARALLGDLGIATDGVTLHDGSGLSRTSRLTTDVLAELDAVMWATVPGWGDLQAEMGRTGTLRRRLRDTLAEGRVFGKTGTLDDVKSVTMTILDYDGRPRWHLAVVDNDRADRFVSQVLADELALLLLEDGGGCTRVLRDEPPTATAPPIVLPYDLACPPGIGLLPDPPPTPTPAATPSPTGATP